MVRIAPLMTSALALTACAHLQPKLDTEIVDRAPTDYVEAVYLPSATPANATAVERIVAVPMPGQLKPIEDAADRKPLRPYQAIDAANASAAIQPSRDGFVNAIQVYPYTPGALYQVYCAPEQVTDIALAPGEELISVSAGDTMRWVLGDTVSGGPGGEQVHILIKPIAPSLKTTLIVATSERTYHVELTSFRETYMAAVSWRYPQPLVRRSADGNERRIKVRSREERPMRADSLNFAYKIEGDDPDWRPIRAFDDGRKVYIQFPARLDRGEAPPLFVLGRNGESQLVNYRIDGATYIVDRLFGAAELRLGEDDQDIVRVIRTGRSDTVLAGL